MIDDDPILKALIKSGQVEAAHRRVYVLLTFWMARERQRQLTCTHDRRFRVPPDRNDIESCGLCKMSFLTLDRGPGRR